MNPVRSVRGLVVMGMLVAVVLTWAVSPAAARRGLGPHPVPCSPAPCGDLGGPPLPKAPNGALEYPQSEVVSVAPSVHELVLGQRLMITRSGHCDSSASNSIAGGSGCDFAGLVGLSLCPGAKPPKTLALTEHDGFTECYVATAPTSGWVVFTAVAGNCGVSQCTGGNYYEISADGATLSLAGHGRPGLSVQATITAFGHVRNAVLKLSLAPGDYLSHVVGANAGSKRTGRLEVKKALGAVSAGRHVLRISADVASLFAAPGHTVHAMNAVGGKKPGTRQSAGWANAPPAPATTGGDELIFSDSPEYLLGKSERTRLKDGTVRVAPATELATGQVAGNQVEGILYRQTTPTAAGDFRVYLNHENRTPVPKDICVVIAPSGPGVTELTRDAIGEGEKPGDPVLAGERALAAYEADRRKPRPQTMTLGASHPAYSQCFGPIVNKGAAGVINAIIDYHASAPVKVGVVAIDSERNHQARFQSDPLGYHFADAKHPNGDPSRTYVTDAPLKNPGESHVAGTFPYDEVTVHAMVNLTDAQPFGMLLAGNPAKSPGQYVAALDRDHKDNKGNYGVFYHVSVTVTGSAGERAEIVFNPRSVGFDSTTGVTNAFGGIADVPSITVMGTVGHEIHIPSSGVIKHNEDGTVLGTVHGGETFSFDFMPPGGAVAPDAIVVLPELVRVLGTLGFTDGTATGTPDPLTVALG